VFYTLQKKTIIYTPILCVRSKLLSSLRKLLICLEKDIKSQNNMSLENNETEEIIDGLDFLIDILGKKALKDIIRLFYFINPEDVIKINEKIINNEKIPVRFSKKENVFIKQNDIKQTKHTFKNKADAVDETQTKCYYSILRPDIPILVDKDGNTAVRENIAETTGQIVNSINGEKNTVINCMLCHIWDKTDRPSISRSFDPLYFSLLWNIVIIPLPLAFITDKNEDNLYKLNPNSKNKKFVKLIKNLIKAIAINLYNPNEFINKFINDVNLKNEINDDFSVNEREWSHENIMKFAKKLINDNDVRFLPHKNN
jgi:hypothetical protein